MINWIKRKKKLCAILKKIYRAFLFCVSSNRRKFIINLWKIKIFDKKNGTNFAGRISQEKLGFTDEEGNDYSASPMLLIEVLKDCNISTTDKILDLGCGKGAAMFFMNQFPFAKILGVEKSDMLSKIALDNMHKIEFQNNNRFAVRNIDACEYGKTQETKTELDEFNYIYIYNAFPKQVLEKVMKNICESMRRRPREIILLYLFPEAREVVEKTGIFLLDKQYFQNELRGGMYKYTTNKEDYSNYVI